MILEKQIHASLEALKSKYSKLDQSEPLEEYKNEIEKHIKKNSLISASIAVEIIEAYPIVNNWKIFKYLLDDLQCLQQEEVYSKALRATATKCSIPREFAYSYFGNTLASPKHLMNDKEYKEYLKLPDEIILYRGANKDEQTSGKHNVSWTSNQNIAIRFAFYSYKNIDPKSRVVLVGRINKKYIKAIFNNSREWGNEHEKIVLLENDYELDIFCNWEEYQSAQMTDTCTETPKEKIASSHLT